MIWERMVFNLVYMEQYYKKILCALFITLCFIPADPIPIEGKSPGKYYIIWALSDLHLDKARKENNRFHTLRYPFQWKNKKSYMIRK
ncbi:MAG: hypothetical protein GY754_42340 [bacterium]|nr:hypothetical protein [bacterium]